jgi:hypothetical protein
MFTERNKMLISGSGNPIPFYALLFKFVVKSQQDNTQTAHTLWRRHNLSDKNKQDCQMLAEGRCLRWLADKTGLLLQDRSDIVPPVDGSTSLLLVLKSWFPLPLTQQNESQENNERLMLLQESYITSWNILIFHGLFNSVKERTVLQKLVVGHVVKTFPYLY